MDILLCDGPANGQWCHLDPEVQEGDTVLYPAGSDVGAYEIVAWPTGELVGMAVLEGQRDYGDARSDIVDAFWPEVTV